jgi:hypothetical protein
MDPIESFRPTIATIVFHVKTCFFCFVLFCFVFFLALREKKTKTKGAKNEREEIDWLQQLQSGRYNTSIGFYLATSRQRSVLFGVIFRLFVVALSNAKKSCGS